MTSPHTVIAVCAWHLPSQMLGWTRPSSGTLAHGSPDLPQASHNAGQVRLHIKAMAPAGQGNSEPLPEPMQQQPQQQQQVAPQLQSHPPSHNGLAHRQPQPFRSKWSPGSQSSEPQPAANGLVDPHSLPPFQVHVPYAAQLKQIAAEQVYTCIGLMSSSDVGHSTFARCRPAWCTTPCWLPGWLACWLADRCKAVAVAVTGRRVASQLTAQRSELALVLRVAAYRLCWAGVAACAEQKGLSGRGRS